MSSIKKRIYSNLIGISLFCVLLISLTLGAWHYIASKKQEEGAVRESACLIADILDRSLKRENDKNVFPTQLADFITSDRYSARLTIISPNGQVLIDNKTDAQTLENHAHRAEVLQALATGHGESMRYSKTLHTITYYYALRLADGNVLRVSQNMNSIVGIFRSTLPVTFMVMIVVSLIANFAAKRLTKNIVDPINRLILEGENRDVYEELTPYLRRIEHQRNRISAQIHSLRSRADTIKIITENMREGLLLVDKKGNILSSNASAQELFDTPDINTKNILHICRQLDLLQAVQHALQGNSSDILLKRNKRSYRVHINPVLTRREVTGAALLFVDNTARAEGEKMRREFSANVSHELKTPLTTISALAEMLQNGMVQQGDISQFAGKIVLQAERMKEMINDIIRLANFDEKVTPLERERFDLTELAQSTFATLQEKADGKGITFHLQAEPIHFSANRRMIDELLYNLIDNAITYNRVGGRVSVYLEELEKQIQIQVQDNGIGIAKEQQERVFERFYRADPSRSNRTGGTGLGLSIVKHIIEHHGGSISLQSKQGEGSLFTCLLPK